MSLDTGMREPKVHADSDLVPRPDWATTLGSARPVKRKWSFETRSTLQ